MIIVHSSGLGHSIRFLSFVRVRCGIPLSEAHNMTNIGYLIYLSRSWHDSRPNNLWLCILATGSRNT